MFDLAGKTALVTGASRGIGRNVATCLARAGADIVLWGRDLAGLEQTRAEIEPYGVQVAIDAFDITEAESVTRASVEAIERFVHIDILVVNAGVNILRPFLEWTPDQWNHMIDVNLIGAIHTLQAIGRHMTERKQGSIITMASIYSHVGAPDNSIYCLTKGGMMQLTKSLAMEWSRYKVRVNAICPGWIETDLTAPYMQDENACAAGLRQIPLRRFGRPSDIGPMAVYLASDEAQWTTGQGFVVDGGQIAR
ncbi:oxidoreductase [Pollutimonas nitritireducens]|uniref:Oxidoreductase n=1 Tax=Pollutimonas nitritireducens TaxID=2045209 RepID=A0A2N4UG17_9BURK|nr:oxidoreductase [Pollutimonas nitritireducens]